VFNEPLARGQPLAQGRKKFRFKNKLAMLLLRYLQLRARFAWSLSNLLALLRMNLFTHRDLWAWLEEPYTAPPPLEAPEPEALALG
jgi:hypothetical protein